jgi:Domain of unknown function (DUF4908)
MPGPFRAILANAILCLAIFAGAAAHAQDGLDARLSEDRFANIQTGSYLAGDHVEFALDYQRGNFLLRFQDDPEVFVLYSDRASMGGRVLKYDSGETVIHVTVWGGITLYTDARPGGLPAVRTGDTAPFLLPDVSMSQIDNAAAAESRHLRALHLLRLGFTTDWNAIANNTGLRALYYDAMENAARGFNRFVASAAAREALSKHVNTVWISTAGRPTVNLSGKTLRVTFNPDAGYEGRASSRAIARGLSKLLGVP